MSDYKVTVNYRSSRGPITTIVSEKEIKSSAFMNGVFRVEQAKAKKAHLVFIPIDLIDHVTIDEV